jgi:hypothetical protein
MTRRALATFTLLATVCFAAPGVMAYQNQNHNDKDNGQWQTKGDYEYRTYPLRPTDWPQGTKTDWSNCSSKSEKAGQDVCKYVTYEGRFIYYYTGKGGTVYARRPVNKMYQPHDTAKDATK